MADSHEEHDNWSAVLGKFCKPVIDNELVKKAWDDHLAFFTKRDVDKLGLGYTDQSQILMYNFGACPSVRDGDRGRDRDRDECIMFYMASIPFNNLPRVC